MISAPEAMQTAKPDSVGRQPPWLLLGILSVLLVLCYFPVLRLLVRDWMIDENVSHGFFVPVVALYVAWQKREELLSVRVRRNWWGLVIVVLAALQLYVATLGAELFLARMAFVFSIWGIVLFLGGMALLRLLVFPLILLFFMIPLPAILYNQVTFPLQILASRFAETTLSAIGIPVIREGNILELPSQRLSVVEACSGIRSLLSLMFLSLVYGFMFERKLWIRFALFLSTVPIAIFANAGRVTLTGLLSEYDTELASGVFHLVEGWVIFLIALVLLMMTHQMIGAASRIVGKRVPPSKAG